MSQNTNQSEDFVQWSARYNVVDVEMFEDEDNAIGE